MVHQILNMKGLNSVNLFVQNGFCLINNLKRDTKSFQENVMNEVFILEYQDR